MIILSVHAKNFMVFKNYVLFNLKVNEYMDENFHEQNLFKGKYSRIVRSALVLGTNNAGKSCLIKAIHCIREFMFGRLPMDDLKPNPYSGSNIVTLGMKFVYNGTEYEYDFDYDVTLLKNGKRNGFVSEYLDRIDHISEDSDCISYHHLFGRSREFNEYYLNDDKYRGRMLKKFPPEETTAYTSDSYGNPVLGKCRHLLGEAASEMDVVDMNDISLDKTLEALKYDMPEKDRIAEFIRGAGLYIDDIEYRKKPEEEPDADDPEDGEDPEDEEDSEDDDSYEMEDDVPDEPEDESAVKDEAVLYGPEDWAGADGDQVVLEDDLMRLYSCRNGTWYRTLERDSEAAVKLIALSGYIVDALDNGKALVVDDLCRYVHPNIVSKIMELFGLQNCPDSQLIFTASDTSLLDGKIKRLRMDQIFFMKRERTNINVRSMAGLCFRADTDRDCVDGDWRELYRHGYFGAVPDTDWDEFAGDIPEKKKRAH
ncbi:MAG: ATP-binding protein [Clostridia bacterium]|nr:ATP-binding protein [Clostridia bacterium]